MINDDAINTKSYRQDTIYFRLMIKNAAMEGIFLAVKYGIIIAAIVYAFNFSMQTRTAAVNGEQAALVINEYIAKGWLPAIQNGQVPVKASEAAE